MQATIQRLAAVAVAAAAYAIALGMRVDIETTLIWPPSRSSAPFLVGSVLAVLVVMIVSFGGASPEQEHVRSVKRSRFLAQLAQALRWDEPREDEDKDAARRPPETKELYNMLYDDIEERHVTEFSIAADDPSYVGALALFKERLGPDLDEAVRCTRAARGGGELADGDDPKRAALFRDGSRLRELVELHKKIGRHFTVAKELKPKLEAARAALRTFERESRRDASHVLWSLLRPQLPLFGLSCALMTFDSLVGALNYHMTARILDGVADGSVTLDEVRNDVVVMFVKFTLCIGAHLGAWCLTHKVTGRFTLAVKDEVMRGILSMDTVFFDIHSSGIIQKRLNQDASDLSTKLFQIPLNVLHHSVMLVTNVVALWQMRSEFLWGSMLPLVPIVAIQCLSFRWIQRMHERGRKLGERVVETTHEVVKELRTVRAFAMEEEEAGRYSTTSLYKTQIDERFELINHMGFITPLILVFTAVRLSAVYVGGWYLSTNILTVGMALQLASSVDHMQHWLREIFMQLPEFLKVIGPVGRIIDAINSRPKIEPRPGDAPKLTTPIRGHIEFEDVNFTFPSEPQKPILRGLSFDAAPGKKVGFVGSTGCGKSTALQLIQRFYDPCGGRILLDGVPIDAFDVHHLRRSIAVVPQDSVLFTTTIRENVTYGLPKAARDALTSEDIEAACRKANAWEFIEGFPRRLETFCGERGVKLSGGQKQRLCIARAIIRPKARLLLLDEATAALDSKAEKVVQAALDRMIESNDSGATLMIAHRLSTVRNCDAILAMHKGVVVERGTHDELLENEIVKKEDGTPVSGLYRELWETQNPASAGGSAAEKGAAMAARQVGELMAQVSALKRELDAAKQVDWTRAARDARGVTGRSSSPATLAARARFKRNGFDTPMLKTSEAAHWPPALEATDSSGSSEWEELDAGPVAPRRFNTSPA